MNTFPIVSVIVPVYNAEKYLTQCIDSILSQDFTDFELLLIDDGSKDKSNIIINEYANIDVRVKIFHKENGGVSSARNLGIDKALGEYITFIDSDDYVDSNYLSILNSKNADLIVTGYSSFKDDNTNTTVENYTYCDSIYTGDKIAECLSSVLNDTSMRSPWDKLFKCNIIKQNKIYFDTTLRIGEDTVFVQKYLQYCQDIVFLKGAPYHYRLPSDNISCFKYSLSSNEYLYTLKTMLQAYKELTTFFSFSHYDYFLNIKKLTLMLYFRNLAKEGFSLQGFLNFKHTMKQLCPEVFFSEKLYRVGYNLLKMNQYFLSYLILSFLYPITIFLKEHILLKKHKK